MSNICPHHGIWECEIPITKKHVLKGVKKMNRLPNINLRSLTSTAQHLYKGGSGYRYENISTGVYPIEESLLFEVEELGNDDVFQTIYKLYNKRCKNVKQIIRWIYSFFDNVDIVWGLWVSTKDGVQRYYVPKSDYYNGFVTLTKYQLPPEKLIISDLGDEGTWYATPVYPPFLPTEEILISL